MPYIILAFGVLLALYGLYRFFLVASVAQIRAMTMTVLLLTVCGAMLFLALTGRLPAALGLLLALSPLALSWWKNKKAKVRQPSQSSDDEPHEPPAG